MTDAGDVGPVPEGRDPEDYDRLRRRVLWLLATGLYVVGSRGQVEGQVTGNLMTANLVVQVALEPKLVAVSIDATALTRTLIDDGGVFAVSILDRDDRAVVRRFTKPVPGSLSADGGAAELGGEPVLTAATGAPIVARARAWLDCRVTETLVLGSHVLYVGEVVDAGESPSAGDEPPEILRMEDTRMHYGG